MKKRILALALVIVSLVTVLTGCAYRYDKKDMTKYATVEDNYAGLEELLKNITIAGDDFGPYVKGSTVRDDKVLEKIDSTLASKINTTTAAKLKDAAVYTFRQKIYYAYYCTVEKDGTTYYFDTKNMDDAKLSTFLSNPTYTNGAANEELAVQNDIAKKVFEAIEGLKVTEYAYDSVASGAIAKDDVVFATYKYTYTDANNKPVSVSSEYMLLIADEKPAAGATKIEQLLVGKNLGKIEGTTASPLEFTDPTLGKCVVDSMTVHFKSTGKSVEVKDTLTAAKTVTNAANTATASKISLAKDDVVTYHVFPAYAYAVEELNATNIIKTIFGNSISTSSLAIFADNEKMKPLVEEVSKLKTAYDQANSKVTSAGSSATAEQKKTRDEAKAKLDTAFEALPAKLLATSTDAEKKILDEYKESVYNALETSHDATVRTQLGKEIWKWVTENVKVDTNNLPKSAVKEAKDRIIAAHKNEYYTGQDSTTKIAYTETYKTFDEYLAAVAYKDKDADAVIDSEAKAEVVDIIRVYAVAQKYEDKVARVTKADISLYIDEIYPSLYYTFYLQGNYNPTVDDVLEYYGETAIRCSLTFDRIMDYFLATEEVDGHVVYKNIKKINYK